MSTLVTFACVILLQPTQSSLQKDTILSRYFAVDEIIQLDSIRVFFNQQMINNCSNSSLEACYKEYLNQLNSSDNLDLGILYAEQRDLFEKIDESLFSSIWQYTPIETHTASSATDDVIKYQELGYNRQGDYINFLEDVAVENPYFDKYLDAIRAAGTLPPSLIDGFAYDASGLDFNDPRHQLILAIHFLTFNDRIANTQ